MGVQPALPHEVSMRQALMVASVMRTIVLLALVAACHEPAALVPPPVPPPPPPPVPTLPAAASAMIDLDFFVQPLAPGDSAGDNWWYTSSRVSETRSTNDAILLVAREILKAAPNYSPVLQGDRWRWHFTLSLEGGSPYTADLGGSIVGDESVWEARVTAPSHGIVNGKWFDGRAKTDGSSGSWKIYHLQVDSTIVLGTVVWSHDATGWSVTLQDHALYHDTSHITYSADGAQRGMTSIKFLMPAADTVPFEVHWDTLARSGSLLAPVFNGGVKVCWGAHLQNIVCPP